MERLDPTLFDLPHNTIINKISDNLVAIVKIRKSRILMKDGETILEHAEKIREKLPDTTVVMQTTAPVCSKTEKFLADNGIRVEKTEIMF